MKKIITLILFFSFSLPLYSQTKYDTLVRKKYIDSLKYQLSLYKVSSFNHLNLYNIAENRKDSIHQQLNIAENYIYKMEQINKRKNISYGIAGAALMILSFIGIVSFSQ